MRSREDLFPAEPKIESFLTNLAVQGNVGKQGASAHADWNSRFEANSASGTGANHAGVWLTLSRSR